MFFKTTLPQLKSRLADKPKRWSMRTHNRGRFGISILLLLVSPALQSPSHGTDALLRLSTVLQGDTKDSKGRDLRKDLNATADARGGELRASVKYTDKCSESYLFSWSFDRDVTTLRPGDSFSLRIAAKRVSDGCASSVPVMQATGGTSRGTRLLDWHRRDTGRKLVGGLFSHNTGTIEATEAGQTASTMINVPDELRESATAAWFVFDMVVRTSKIENQAFRYQVVYLYDLTHSSPMTGLYLEAGEKIVDRGEKVSVPIYLRYRGSGTPPLVTNMNFEVGYESDVAQVRPHPNPAEKPSGTTETKEPELPRGNLLSSSTMIAGNTAISEKVLVGFAGRSGVKPGTGRPGETITEIYYQAVGNPGDQTPLILKVTTSMDADGHPVPVETVNGSIRIRTSVVVDPHRPLDDPGTPPTGTKDQPDQKWMALDAYIALLMSVGRRESKEMYDLDKDSRVTSTDSAIILREATKIRVR